MVPCKYSTKESDVARLTSDKMYSKEKYLLEVKRITT